MGPSPLPSQLLQVVTKGPLAASVMLAGGSLRKLARSALPGARRFSAGPSTDVRRVTLIKGDGIGPEISQAVIDIFQAAEVKQKRHCV